MRGGRGADGGPVRAADPQRRPLPELHSLCGATFALLLNLAVFLNVMGQLCPPAELSAAPAYVLLCVARVGPTRLGVAMQCCLTAVALGAVPRKACFGYLS